MTRGGKAVGWLLCVAGLALSVLSARQAAAVDFAQAIPPEYRIGGKWALGCQAYSFNRYTFFEAIDKTKETGCKLIEAFPGQKLSPDDPTPFDHNAPQAALDAAKKKLDAAGIKLVAYGVVGLGNDEASMRKVFDFAKKMGILVIVSEPEEKLLPLVDKLAKEYDIPVAIHNHPNPSRYWDCKHLLESVKDLDKYVGSCADTGHWMRSSIVPLDAVKMLEGHIVSMHIKDLNQMGPGSKDSPTHDVPFGTGKADMTTILDELTRQGFNGPMSIEYEWNWTASVPEITQCVEFLKKYAGEKATTGEKAGKKVGKRGGKRGAKKAKAATP